MKARGPVFVAIIVLVANLGSLFFLPTCQFLLIAFSPVLARVARKPIDFVVSLWLKLIPALLEVVFGVKVKICGDLKKLDGPCLILLNHRTRFDWMFFWCFLMRMGNLHTHKIILKKPLKKVPFFGWATQAAQFLFVSRDWAVDKEHMTKNLSYFRSIPDYPLQLLIFPEGTDLSDSNKEKSQKFAKEKGLEPYEYVLHPRLKGSIHCITEMRKFKVAPKIINMSVAYVGGIPQNERDLATGNWPKEIHFFAEHIPHSNVPEDVPGLEKWLTELWAKKETQLKNFQDKKRFDAEYQRPVKMVEAYSEMKMVLGFWVVFFLWMGYSLATSYFYWYYLPFWTVFFVLLNLVTSGTDNLLLRLMV